jgi:hypothetical protein
MHAATISPSQPLTNGNPAGPHFRERRSALCSVRKIDLAITNMQSNSPRTPLLPFVSNPYNDHVAPIHHAPVMRTVTPETERTARRQHHAQLISGENPNEKIEYPITHHRHTSSFRPHRLRGRRPSRTGRVCRTSRRRLCRPNLRYSRARLRVGIPRLLRLGLASPTLWLASWVALNAIRRGE